ncbi:methylmalonyl-CoA mutase family protein [uncultured Corynebacterium sp.]|uniref:methylmalonyl-CoA mutase family protein n=1 Tax=uncultured Corynebacterium sp. TaxID=159447 RepID=UPI0025D4F8EF|nr:methylmalonyl-CoA mutase family protein [uncultured Corynebacterium sp.]
MTDRTATNAAGTALPPNFEEQQTSWYKAVAGVFARTRKQDVSDIPLDVWTKLNTTTYDGVEVRPLYTRADDLAEAPIPGRFPFTRGSRLRAADRAGWGVRETFGRTGEGSATAVNEALLGGLTNGTTSIRLDLRNGLTAADLPTLLKGVYFDLVPVAVEAGDRVGEVAEALFELIDSAGVENPDALEIELSAAPLTSLYTGAAEVSLDTAVEMAVANAKRTGTVRTLLVDGVAFANMGATDSQEIGYALAVGVAYLRALTEAGLSVEEALEQISFRYSATDDQFNTIAKFRAARTLWARVAEVAGAPGHGSAPNHAVTAPVMFSQRDPWVNMLRSTVAAFGAGVGGATTVEVLPFDNAIHGGQPGVSRTFAARIARNTNLLLLEESHLGFVADPAGGSYYVEELTDSLEDRAWKIFTDVESYGGIVTAADHVRENIDAAFQARREDIAHRRTKITAINEFPNLAEAPLAPEARPMGERVRRWAADFEGLRNRSDDFLAEQGRRPQVALLPLGPLAKHNIRTGFATNLLASGGIEALNPGQVVPGEDAFAQAATAATIVVVCGADGEYSASGADAVAAAREAGASEVYVAGPEKLFADVEGDARPDGFLTMNIDAVAHLSRLLDSLGA